MIDLELNKTIKKLYNFLTPDAIEKIKSHLLSIHRKVEDLSKSRDNWKRKYEDLKSRELKK